jgi:acetoin utilization protein AcuB
MIAKHLITDLIPCLKPSDSISTALELMGETNLSQLAVSEDGVLLGVLLRSDCIEIRDPQNCIGDIQIELSGTSIPENEHLFEVIKLMTSSKLTLLPVVNNDQEYLGSITLSGLLPYLAQIMDVNSPGSIIVLEIASNDYNLSEISQIVSSNDAKILSLYVSSLPDSSRLEVTLKVNLLEIGPILQTFSRFNYLINATWAKDDAYNEGLHDRFDALMNYLNI